MLRRHFRSSLAGSMARRASGRVSGALDSISFYIFVVPLCVLAAAGVISRIHEHLAIIVSLVVVLLGTPVLILLARSLSEKAADITTSVFPSTPIVGSTRGLGTYPSFESLHCLCPSTLQAAGTKVQVDNDYLLTWLDLSGLLHGQHVDMIAALNFVDADWIQDQLRKGYVSKTDLTVSLSDAGKAYYLSHGVLTLEKASAWRKLFLFGLGSFAEGNELSIRKIALRSAPQASPVVTRENDHGTGDSVADRRLSGTIESDERVTRNSAPRMNRTGSPPVAPPPTDRANSRATSGRTTGQLLTLYSKRSYETPFGRDGSGRTVAAFHVALGSRTLSGAPMRRDVLTFLMSPSAVNYWKNTKGWLEDCGKHSSGKNLLRLTSSGLAECRARVRGEAASPTSDEIVQSWIDIMRNGKAANCESKHFTLPL